MTAFLSSLDPLAVLVLHNASWNKIKERVQIQNCCFGSNIICEHICSSVPFQGRLKSQTYKFHRGHHPYKGSNTFTVFNFKLNGNTLTLFQFTLKKVVKYGESFRIWIPSRLWGLWVKLQNNSNTNYWHLD